MNHGWSSFGFVKRFKMSSECQNLCWIERNAVVWPRHEMELLHHMSFIILDKNVFFQYQWRTKIALLLSLHCNHVDEFELPFEG